MGEKQSRGALPQIYTEEPGIEKTLPENRPMKDFALSPDASVNAFIS